MGLGELVLGVVGEFQKASYPLMSLNKLFTTKWNPKRYNNALKTLFFKIFEGY